MALMGALTVSGGVRFTTAGRWISISVPAVEGGAIMRKEGL